MPIFSSFSASGLASKLLHAALKAATSYISRLAPGSMPISDVDISNTTEGESYSVFSSTVSGLTQGVIMKHSSAGVVTWTKRITHSTYNVYLKDSVVTSDGGVVVSGYVNDGTSRPYLIARFSSTGSLSWVTCGYSASGALSSADNVAIDASDNVYITPYDDSGARGYIAKYSSTGSYQWAKYYQGFTPYSGGVCVDSSGYSWLAQRGSEMFMLAYIQKYNSSGSLQFGSAITYTADEAGEVGQVVPDASGNVYLTVETLSATPMILKISSTGGIVWAKKFASIQGNFAYGVVGPDGSIYFCGYQVNGSRYEATIIKMTDSGSISWARRFYNTAAGALTTGDGISISASGNLSIVARSRSSSGVGYSLVTLSVPTDGTKTGTYTLGDATYAYSAYSPVISNATGYTIGDGGYVTGSSSFTAYSASFTVADELPSQSSNYYSAVI